MRVGYVNVAGGRGNDGGDGDDDDDMVGRRKGEKKTRRLQARNPYMRRSCMRSRDRRLIPIWRGRRAKILQSPSHDAPDNKTSYGPCDETCRS